MPRILSPKERRENCGQRPFRAWLAKAERATRCRKRVLKSDMVLLEKEESGARHWSGQAVAKSPCKVPVSRVSCCIACG